MNYLILHILKISKGFIFVFYVRSFLGPFHFRFPENIGLHSIFIEQMIFCEVYNIKSYFFLFLDINNFEKIPACVSFSITIDSHYQVIFIWVDCNSQVKVSTLKLWTKFDILIFRCGIYSFKKPVFARSNRKILFRLVKMKEFKLFKGFFGVKKIFLNNFMVFIFGILFKKFHIRAGSKSHVNDFIWELWSKRCKSFGDEINIGMCKDKWNLFERDVGNCFNLPSLIRKKNTQYINQEVGSDHCVYSFVVWLGLIITF